MSPGIIRTKEGVYVLEKDSHLSRWIEEHGRLDIAEGEIKTFANLIPRGATVIDAGACLGDHTETYRKLVGSGGRVFAIEPNPLTYEALSLNFEPHQNVICLNAALSDEAGESRFHPEENAGASYITKNGSITVKTVTIDSLNLSRLDFIHLDCEGHEKRVLSGGLESIRRFRPSMVIEINHGALARNANTEQDVVSLLANLGYLIRETESHHGPNLPQRDIIATPL